MIYRQVASEYSGVPFNVGHECMFSMLSVNIRRLALVFVVARLAFVFVVARLVLVFVVARLVLVFVATDYNNNRDTRTSDSSR